MQTEELAIRFYTESKPVNRSKKLRNWLIFGTNAIKPITNIFSMKHFEVLLEVVLATASEKTLEGAKE